MGWYVETSTRYIDDLCYAFVAADPRLVEIGTRFYGVYALDDVDVGGVNGAHEEFDIDGARWGRWESGEGD